MLNFTIDSQSIVLDTVPLYINISTPFVLTLTAIVVALRVRKLVRDRARKAETPVFDADFDWNS